MSESAPLVLEGVNLAGFVQYVLDKHTAPSILIVCGSKGGFLRQLHLEMSEPSPAAAILSEGGTTCHSTRHRLLSRPTLRLLASSRSVRVVFCPELPHLRAYLAGFAFQQPVQANLSPPNLNQPTGRRLLAILNPIQLHRPTSSYSAQGINQTFATAVEAAYNTNSQLVLSECTTSTDRLDPPHDFPEFVEEHDAGLDAEPDTSPWDSEVSILNVTTKSFGAGERGWMGRTVSIRRIAGRWCRFADMSGHET